MSKSGLRGAALSLAMGGLVAGCASHRFVHEQVGAVEGRVAGVDRTAAEALARANVAHRLAEGKFLYSVVLSDESVKFPVKQHALSAEAETRLTALAERLKREDRNVYLEIQGHTDDQGPEAYNDRLGAARAETVRRFLAKAGVPLHRMAVISYGEEEPTAPNSTAAGRSQNRRVTVVVLE